MNRPYHLPPSMPLPARVENSATYGQQLRTYNKFKRSMSISRFFAFLRTARTYGRLGIEGSRQTRDNRRFGDRSRPRSSLDHLLVLSVALILMDAHLNKLAA